MATIAAASPMTTTNGIQPMTTLAMPHTMAATATPLPWRRGGSIGSRSTKRWPPVDTSAVQTSPLWKRSSYRPAGSGYHPLTARTLDVPCGVELVLIRHGQPEWVREGLNVVDPPLTELGHRQAEGAGRGAGRASTSTRCSSHRSCGLARRRRHCSSPSGGVEDIDLWLEEIRDPNWHGTPAEHAAEAYEELRSRPSLDRWRGLPGGEDIREFVQRIRLGAEKFLQERGVVQVESELPVWQIEEPGRRIALVAHNGTNSIVICHLLGLPPTPWEWERLVLRHASVSRLEAIPLGDGYTFSLTALSDVEHIPVADRTR